MSLWGVMFQKLQLFCLCTLAHKIFRACSPPQGLSKNIKFWGGGLPNFWEIWTKVQTFNPHISSPKGFWGPILVWGDRGPKALRKFRNWGTWPPPPIFGEFFSEFLDFQLWPQKSRIICLQFFLNFAGGLHMQTTSQNAKKNRGSTDEFSSQGPPKSPSPF